MSIRSDGSTASYYELPAGAKELQDLISYRNLNAQDGEIFRAIYRKGRASHSDELRDAKKVLFYAQAEVKRLESLAADQSLDMDEARADVIGQNGNEGEHYRGQWPEGTTHVHVDGKVYMVMPMQVYVYNYLIGGWQESGYSKQEILLSSEFVKIEAGA